MLTSFIAWYSRIFSLEEVQQVRGVQTLFYLLLGYQILLFSTFVGDDAGTLQAVRENLHTCWPYFKNCGDWYFLQLRPYGYSQAIFYSFVFIAQVSCIFSALRNRWVFAHALFLGTWLWQVIFLFLLSYEIGEAFSYYHTLLSAVWLFAMSREWMSKTLIVGLYFLGGFIDFFRAYFLDGPPQDLPIIPASAEVLVINIAIVLQWIGVWYLLSDRVAMRRTVIIGIAALHIYASGIFDLYFAYFIIPVLITLFWFDSDSKTVERKSVYHIVVVLFLLLLVHGWIVFSLHTRNFTFARPHLGIATYFPSTSGVSVATIVRDGEEPEVIRQEWRNRPCRCSPYSRWYQLQNVCRKNKGTPIAWTLDLSFSGEPLHRVIDVSNVCTSDFSIFSGNRWINSK